MGQKWKVIHPNMKKMKKLNVLSAFSGAGGLDLGFESTGKYSTVACIEENSTYASTLDENKGRLILGIPFLSDATIFRKSVREFIDTCSDFIEKNRFDGVIGGPPCQPFSTIGKRLGLADPRAATLKDFVDLVGVVRPQFFLFENVPNIAWQWSGAILAELVESLSFEGEYRIESKVVNAADFGAFTKRKRLVLIGIRASSLNGSEGPLVPACTHSKSLNSSDLYMPWRTTGAALADIAPPTKGRSDLPTHHVAVTHTHEVAERFRGLLPGEQDKIRKRWRLDLSQPSNSLMAGGNGGYVFHIHPTEPRELTSRECARIQGFPDNFDFSGKPLDVAKQIVNAVPIQLGHSLAEAIYRNIKVR